LSLQVVLFPLDEGKSMNLLNQIIAESNGKLDPETKTYNFVSLVKEDEMNMGFQCLLNRLTYLHDRAAEAPPTSRIGHYLHPWTHRHMDMLTAVGIFAAFDVGVAVSLVFTIMQTNLAKEELNLQREATGRGD
jgi:hypothetical protein